MYGENNAIFTMAIKKLWPTMDKTMANYGYKLCGNGYNYGHKLPIYP